MLVLLFLINFRFERLSEKVSSGLALLVSLSPPRPGVLTRRVESGGTIRTVAEVILASPAGPVIEKLSMPSVLVK